MIKNIIREVSPEFCEFSFYFDGDTFNGYATGNYCDYLFIIDCDRFGRISGFNTKEYNKIREQAEAIVDGFNDVEEKNPYGYATYKEAMRDNFIDFTPRKCHALKEWYKTSSDTDEPADIAKFLTITTGHKWTITSARGYCQGDYVEIVYSPDGNSEETAITAGEIWLGAAKEFYTIDIDENGEEGDTCGGYIIADSQIKNWTDADEEYKRIVCEWDGLNPDTTRLEMIDYNAPIITRTVYSYKTIDPEPVTVSANLPKAAHTTSTKTH